MKKLGIMNLMSLEVQPPFFFLNMFGLSIKSGGLPGMCNKQAFSHMSQGRSTPCIGDGRPPTFNDGNPYNGAL